MLQTRKKLFLRKRGLCHPYLSKTYTPAMSWKLSHIMKIWKT